MSSVEHKQSTDFIACFDTYCRATGALLHAVYEHSPEEADGFYEFMTATEVKIKAISNGIEAAKRKERLDKIAKLMPKVGEELLVDICPWNDETWMQYGRVLLAWHDDEPAALAVWAAIEITRAMTDEENAGRDWQSDDTWNGCVLICRYNDYLSDWRANYPVNECAIEAWGEDYDE
jgi:hypothetical protein